MGPLSLVKYLLRALPIGRRTEDKPFVTPRQRINSSEFKVRVDSRGNVFHVENIGKGKR